MKAEDFLRAFLPRVNRYCPLDVGRKSWTNVIQTALRDIADQQNFHPRRSRAHEDPANIISRKVGGRQKHFTRCGEYLVSVGEFRTVDFAFYSRAKDHVSEKKIQGLGLVKWHWHPLVFIEHEWDTSFGAARKDFFKICLAAVPLRVFIGYGASKHTPTYIASELKDFYKRSQLQQVPEGETLILIGKRRRTRPCEWREIWKLVDQAKQWERLSALDFTNLPFME